VTPSVRHHVLDRHAKAPAAPAMPPSGPEPRSSSAASRRRGRCRPVDLETSDAQPLSPLGGSGGLCPRPPERGRRCRCRPLVFSPAPSGLDRCAGPIPHQRAGRDRQPTGSRRRR
jgi:hypothetical protein